MWRLVGVVCSAVYVVFLCSHSACAFSLRHKPFNHRPYDCSPVPGLGNGSPDMQVLPTGLAFIPSGRESAHHGHIFLFDFKRRTHGVQALDIVGDFDKVTFLPHCLSIWRDPSCDSIFLFVVNYAGGKNVVEKFRFDEKTRTLYYVRTYTDPKFTHLLDIVAIGEDSFYFVNFYDFNWMVEYLYGICSGNVGFYDGTRGVIVLPKLLSPLGINASPNGKYIYVSEFGIRSVTIYKRKSDNTLRLRQVVEVGLVDLINVDVKTGDLWVAGHGDEYLILKYLIPPHTTTSPSRVFRLKTCDGGATVTDVKEVYYNDGRQISGSSIAVHYGQHMLLGSIYTGMLLCCV